LTMYAVEFDKLSGTTKLFLDFIKCQKPASEFFEYNFKDTSSYQTVAERIDGRKYEREKAASMIMGASSNFGFSDEIKQNIEKLAAPRSVCVFAGQQVGLLLGPMYTMLKALTAYKLAQKLEIELHRPVVPCFWMASDDHDFDEIKTAYFLDRDGNCKGITYNPETQPSGAPMANTILAPEVESFLDAVDRGLLPTEFSDDIRKQIRETYRAGRSASEAFTDLFTRLTGKLGIVPVDPNFRGMKAEFAPVFRREIEEHEKIFELFESQSQKIVAAGYHRQVHKAGNNLNLFYYDGQRRNIIAEGDKFRFDGHNEGHSKGGLVKLLNERPELFSANVMTRAIAQSHLFPTVSQIVGPSEAAYFAQIRPLFEFHGVPWPVVRPRIFASVLEPHISRMKKKLAIDFAGLANDVEFEVGRAIIRNFPAQTLERAEQVRREVEEPLRELAESLRQGDIESYQAIDHTRRRIDHELNHLSKKLIMAHKKKHEDARKRIYKVAAFLLPCGKFQERVLCPIYFANKFGPEIFAQLNNKLDLNNTGHQLVEIEA